MCAYRKLPLGIVLARVQHGVPIEPQKTYKQVTVRLFHRGVVLRGEKPGSAIRTTTQWRIRSGQVLLSRIDARNGAIGIVPSELDEAIVTNDFWAFAVNRELAVPEFLDAYFGTSDFVESCKAASEGTTNRVRLQPEPFLKIEVPLPPLDEQRRIVSRIEELAAKTHQARGLRSQAVGETEQLRQSGTTQCLSSLNGAHIVTIEEVCEVRGGIQKSSARAPGENPQRYITVAHVQRNWIDTSDPRFFEVSDQELERWRLLAGDVLVIEGNGSSDQIGRTALFKGEIENCVHQNHVIRARPNQKRLMPEYLNAYLNSPAGKAQMLEQSRTTSGLFNLSVGRIKALKLPLPSIPDQTRAVKEIDNLQIKLGILKSFQTETAAELDALMPSILAKAFRGEL